MLIKFASTWISSFLTQMQMWFFSLKWIVKKNISSKVFLFEREKFVRWKVLSFIYEGVRQGMRMKFKITSATSSHKNRYYFAFWIF